MKMTALRACCWSIAAFSIMPAAHASDPYVFTQTCPNGDKIGVDMKHKTLSFSRGSQTYRATYDDAYTMTWAKDNPPLPSGVKSMPTGGNFGTDGVFFGDGDVDSNVVCPRDK
ncbi:hypothetical protein [Caballeronia sp. KNU42]